MDNIENNQKNIAKKNFTSFCELFTSRVKENPNAIAAIFEENALTYKELDKRSSQLAHFLREQGITNKTIVALSLSNSLDLLVAFLGILKSGGAYLPIDPNYPKDRKESILNDAKPALVLTEGSLSSIFLSTQNTSCDEYKTQDIAIQPNHLAYIMYTSGSTGSPKGITIEHGALTHASLAYQTMHPTSLVSLITCSISFDPSLLVISHTLSSGGTVCIPESEAILDPDRIVDLIEKHKINYTLCVPSYYSLLLNRLRKLSSLQYVELAGENLPNELPAIHAEMAPNATLYNLYGPSEYAIGATFEKIYDPATKQMNKITIGKPLPNTQVYILDENLKSVAEGVKGEIFIGGKGLARGYLNNEALTAERFIWTALNGQPPIRLYKTGDFGRFLPDGKIEFLGRKDFQVKIRGYRIELGEIEYHISQYPEVNEGVVIVQGEAENHKRLVAYFSARAKEPIAEKLRQHLQNALPHYMVPSAFVQVDTWPRTPNGKIDRTALSELTPMLFEKADEKSLSEMQRTLHQIWKQVLGKETFGIKDNFFDLGGDSLQVVNMQMALEKALGAKINVSVLFQYPTIAQLADHLASSRPDELSFSKSQDVARKQKSAFQQFKKLSSRDSHGSNA